MNTKEKLSDILSRIDALSKELSSLKLAVEELEACVLQSGEDSKSHTETVATSTTPSSTSTPHSSLSTDELKGNPNSFSYEHNEYFVDDFFEAKQSNTTPSMEEVVEPVVEKEEPVRLEEKPKQEPRHGQLMDQFSVIDFFRFRDQLFAQDVAEMSRVINEIENLQSEDELNHYLYDTLQWSPDDIDVIDFKERIMRSLR